jgi:hypothetical protein
MVLPMWLLPRIIALISPAFKALQLSNERERGKRREGASS